jgi:ABC-type Zn2+ transport system substrate-binding protein/surface adhesin
MFLAKNSIARSVALSDVNGSQLFLAKNFIPGSHHHHAHHHHHQHDHHHQNHHHADPAKHSTSRSVALSGDNLRHVTFSPAKKKQYIEK